MGVKWRDVPVGGVGRFAGVRFRRVSDAIVASAMDGSDHVEVEYLEWAGEKGDIAPGTKGLMRADIESEEAGVPEVTGDITAAAWAALYERITDAILDHAERKSILQKLTDLRTSERLEWSGKVEELRRRLDGKGADK